MTTNVGSIDRIARAVLGLVLLGLPFAAGFGAALTVVSVIVGLVLLGTAATGTCPAYSLLGIKTCRT